MFSLVSADADTVIGSYFTKGLLLFFELVPTHSLEIQRPHCVIERRLKFSKFPFDNPIWHFAFGNVFHSESTKPNKACRFVGQKTTIPVFGLN